MGVLNLYRYILTHHESCIHKVDTVADVPSVCVDLLCLDVNVLIHKVVNTIKNINTDNTDVDAYVCAHVLAEIQSIYSAFKPKSVYLAIDGYPGLSKASQQRKRRYASTESSAVFERSKISTGTRFMSIFSEYIKSNVHKCIPVKCTVSDDSIAGEGEAKILRYIRDTGAHHTQTIVVYSIDSDLIFLLMGLKPACHNVFFLRDTLYRHIHTKYLLMDIHTLNDLMCCKSDPRTINDIIFIMIFIGNDFIPNVPAIEITNNGIQYLLEAYATLDEYIVCECEPTTDNVDNTCHYPKYCINNNALCTFVKVLADTEETLLSQKDNPYSWKTHDEYYNTKLNDIDPYVVTGQYLKTMSFIINYYLDRIPSWQYCFKFHYGPWFRDIYNYITANHQTDFAFNVDKPLNAVEQLAMILPKNKHYLIKDVYPRFSVSPILDCYYPSRYHIDRDGRGSFEEIVLLPFIDVDVFRRLITF